MLVKTGLKWFAFAFVLILMIAVSVVWTKRETVESALFARLIRKLSPHLPFQIDSYHLAKNLNALSLSITFHGERIDFAGPLHWKWIRKDGIHLTYEPNVQIAGASAFPLILNVQSAREWTKLENLSASIPETHFIWKKWGVDTNKISLTADFDGDAATVKLDLASLAWINPHQRDQAVNLTAFHLDGKLPHVKETQPLSFNLNAKEAENLFGKFYLDLPLTNLPITLQLADGKHLDLSIGKNRLTAHVEFDKKLPDATDAQVDFKISKVELGELLPWATKNLSASFSFLQTLTDYQFKKGVLQASGSAKVTNADTKSGASFGENFHLNRLSARVSDLSMRSVLKNIAIQGLDFDFHFLRSESTHLAHLSAKELAYHHFSASLAPTAIEWNADGFQTLAALPLKIQNLPLTAGKISAILKPQFKLSTSLHLANTSFDPFANGFCMSAKIPPLTLFGNFSSIEFTKSSIDPVGKLEADLFGGKILLNDLGIYNLDTAVPETDFDIDLGGIDLQKMSAWSHFGEIKGTLEAYAHDVVLQALLPTQYHFMMDVAPFDRSDKTGKIDFSPEAMKNLVKVFTGADLDKQIPGIAGWLMFGWPSHVLGGYDVMYAGLKLTSEEGHIVVETLDPPAIYESERKHFVLYGRRFKMPLNNATYPLIVDASSMANFVHQLVDQLKAIQLKKELEKGIQHVETPENPCEPAEI